jgi:hypothetical protein
MVKFIKMVVAMYKQWKFKRDLVRDMGDMSFDNLIDKPQQGYVKGSHYEGTMVDANEYRPESKIEKVEGVKPFERPSLAKEVDHAGTR